MAALNMKTVILYNLRRIRPDTLEAIKNANDGDMIGVDQSELDSFMPLIVHMPEVERLLKPPKPATKKASG